MAVSAARTTAHDLAHDLRREGRRSLRLAVQLGEQEEVALIHDLSASGLLVESKVELPLNAILTVLLPQTGPRGAVVVWKGEGLLGCRFEQPITPATISAALLRAESRQAAPTTNRERDTPARYLDVEAVSQESASGRLTIAQRFCAITGLSILSWAVIGLAIALLFG